MNLNYSIKSFQFKRIFKSFSLFSWILIIVSCGGAGKKDESRESDVKIEYDITDKAQFYADSVIKTMSLEEKVGQTLMPAIYSVDNVPTKNLLKRYVDSFHVGGVVLFQGDTTSVKNLVAEIDTVSPPLFMAIDAEWGLGMRLHDAPVYPKNGNIDQETGDEELYNYGRKIAMECRRLGINMVLGPVMDIVSSRRSVIGKRSFGGDPEIVSDFGVAYAKGLESGRVISVAKHFPGHGSILNDSHDRVVRNNRTISELDSTDLKPFRQYIQSELSGIMAGHIEAPALDPDKNAASISIDMLTSLLREEMGFKGLILTDSFGMGGAKSFSATEALKAGADIILCPPNIQKEYENIISDIEKGKLDVEIVNDRCRRILFYKYLFLAFEQ